eukprot:7551819-Alexandrium_andersonii.AAC.1
MSASLVGSEMCIRDSTKRRRSVYDSSSILSPSAFRKSSGRSWSRLQFFACLLYTSDAADDM